MVVSESAVMGMTADKIKMVDFIIQDIILYFKIICIFAINKDRHENYCTKQNH